MGKGAGHVEMHLNPSEEQLSALRVTLALAAGHRVTAGVCGSPLGDATCTHSQLASGLLAALPWAVAGRVMEKERPRCSGAGSLLGLVSVAEAGKQAGRRETDRLGQCRGTLWAEEAAGSSLQGARGRTLPPGPWGWSGLPEKGLALGDADTTGRRSRGQEASGGLFPMGLSPAGIREPRPASLFASAPPWGGHSVCCDLEMSSIWRFLLVVDFQNQRTEAREHAICITDRVPPCPL